MKNIKFLLFFVFFQAALFAQNSDGAKKNELSNISGLTASVKGNSIYLSWNNSLPGEPVVILRDNRQIKDLSTAVPIYTQDGETCEFYDRTPLTTEAYYAVISKSDMDLKTGIFVENQNSLKDAVFIQPPYPEKPAVITEIKAVERDDSVIISYKSDSKNRRLVLYRSVNPLTDSSSLVNSVIIGIFNDEGTPIVDYPVPGIPCYYGLIDEESVRTGNVSFIPGSNTTKDYIMISGSIGENTVPNIARNIPLPFLTLSDDADIPPKGLSDEAVSALEPLLNSVADEEVFIPELYIFPNELIEKTSGEDYTLQSIVNSYLKNQQWNNAEKELSAFLSLRRNEDTVGRTNFYLGETAFFKGEYERALMFFLTSKKTYFEKSQEWIQYTLNALTKSKKG